MDPFESFAVPLPSWAAFGDRLTTFWQDSPGKALWRGHAHSYWSLETTFEREVLKIRDGHTPDTPESWEAYATTHLEVFAKSVRGRRVSAAPHQSHYDKPDEWWAYGRHEGLAAPLLDWTLSPYIAAYFAFERPEPSPTGYRSVFFLDAAQVQNAIELTDGSAPPWIRFVDPFIQDSQRLTAQAGMFTRCRLGHDFAACIRNLPRSFGFLPELDLPLTRFDLPETARDDALLHLESMNINALSLFPDAHGAARYANQRLALPAAARRAAWNSVFGAKYAAKGTSSD